ncbi:MAG: translocation/assembly module TamB domain-containing protein [Candidatus Marinimicrobia bacterium]|nr:translocation/assembly module TamB domain-containing protein [Candidatus Neomarinimicrobiota bacterium]
MIVGLAGVFFTKTDVGFTIAFRILRNRIERQYEYHLSVRDLNKSLKTTIEANYLKFSTQDSSIMLQIDTVNLHYAGIFEFLGKRHLDELRLVEPTLHLRIGEKKEKDGTTPFPEISFPNFHIDNIEMKNIHLYVHTPDTVIYQLVDQLQFRYSGRKDGAVLRIDQLRLQNESLNMQVYDLSSEIVVKNNIAKMLNLNFMFNDARVTSSGKIRYAEPLRFQFTFNIMDVEIEKYLHLPVIKEQDKINLRLDVMGDFKEFTANAELSGTLNNSKIRNAGISVEYKNDYLHLLQASFKNPTTDVSLYGSYGLKDKYISTTFYAHAFVPSEWFPALPDFDFRGRFRANGYLDDRLKVKYDFDLLDLYGLSKSSLQGDILFKGMESIILDSTNYIYLPTGMLKVRGEIAGLDSVNLDIYGDISSFDNLKIPGLDELKAENVMMTLKLLGRIRDPDIQMNVNLDTLIYDIYKVNNLNFSLYAKQLISQHKGGMLVSFENASVDSFLIGSVETYIRMDQDRIYLDYLDITHDNYYMNVAGSIRDFKEFSINRLKGTYQDQDVYLLDTVSFTIRDQGFSLSRFDVLYRDALLYGSLDVEKDSIWGSINLAGAELNSLPLISTLKDSVGGLMDLNIGIQGYLQDPVIDLRMLMKNAHAFGLDARRINSRIRYADRRVNVADLSLDFAGKRSMKFNADIPAVVNFKDKNILTLLPDEPLRADFDLKQARLSKLLPFILENLSITGTGDLRGNISGTLNDPVMNGDLSVVNPTIDRIKLDTLRAKVHYSNQYLYFNECYGTANNGRYNGNAFLHLDLRYNTPFERFSPDSSVYAYLQGNDDEMIYLIPFISDVESFKGDLFTQFELKGNFKKTIKNGRVEVRKGHLVLNILGNEIRNIDGVAVMKDNILSVDLQGKLPSVSYTLAGALGLRNAGTEKNYNFNVRGNMDMTRLLEPDFDLRITGDQMSIVTLDENVNLTTGEVDLRVRGKDTLTVSGDVNIREGLIEMAFSRPGGSGPGGAPEASRMRTEYVINAQIDKMYLRNQFIDATLQGEIALLKYASENVTRFGGELETTQGFFNYWASVFELEEGSISFDQFENNHELNFVAYKDIGKGNRIIASITGELNNPEIDFIDEDNQFTKAEIVQQLTIGEIANVTGQSATTTLLALVERPLEQQMQKLGGVGGLDRIDIKGGEGTYIDNTTAVVVGGRIGRNFYLTYEGSREDPLNIEIEYRLNNNVSIVGSADEENVSGSVRLRLQY